MGCLKRTAFPRLSNARLGLAAVDAGAPYSRSVERTALGASMAIMTMCIWAFGERCYSDRVPKTDAETPSRDAARERARLTKSGVAVASVVLFAIAIPTVRGTEQGHARTAHALKPPPSLVDAVARGGFRPGDLAPSQSAPVVQSSGS